MFNDIRLYLKIRPDLNRLKELSRMKLTTNVLGQALLTILHMGNIVTGFVPANDKFYVAAALGLVQLVISVLAHYANPDGSPAALPYGLTDEQTADYQRIFGKVATAIAFVILALGMSAPAHAQTTPAQWQPSYIVGTGASFDYYGHSGFAALTTFGFKAVATSSVYSFSTLEMTSTTATVRTGAAYPLLNQGNWQIWALGDAGIATGSGTPTIGSFSGGGFVTYDICSKVTKGAAHCGLAGGGRILTNVSQGVNPVGELIFVKAW